MLYAYKCRTCGSKLDGSYPMGFAPSEVQCPTCGEQMRRDFSNVGFACHRVSRDLYADKIKLRSRNKRLQQSKREDGL
jgi:putative FmdB family regulatory protein